MSQKGLYKKTIGRGWDHDQNSQRPKENRFYENAQSGEVENKKKHKAKGKPRADHKHAYEPVLVWGKCLFSNQMRGRVRKYCPICGRVDSENIFSLFNNKAEHAYFGGLKHFQEDETGSLVPIDESTYRKTVFLGGTESVHDLPLSAKNALVDMMNCGYILLVGDRQGADLQLQKLLAEKEYKNVIVYYGGERPRLNLGAWRTKSAPSNKHDTGVKKQAHMLLDCDRAFLLVRGVGDAVTEAIRSLLSMKKACEVVLYDGRTYGGVSCANVWGIKTEEDFAWLLQRMEMIKEGNK